MPRDAVPIKIALIAGEASGDVLGSRLMRALSHEMHGRAEFCGVGGPLMEAEGLRSLFPMRDIAVMGFAEVLPRLPLIMARIKMTVNFIVQEKPDIVVTIDSPDFCFRVVAAVRQKMKTLPRFVHYVAPTVWAWRPERAKKVAALYDGIICLFPFEPPYFEAEGMKACFAGHPAIENAGFEEQGKNLRRSLGIPDGAEVLGVLFGSRMSEINRIGPVLRDAVATLAAAKPGLHIVSPTFPHLEKQVINLLQGVQAKTHVLTGADKKWPAFAAMDRAIATSGTVGLELAVAGVPHLIAYRAHPLTAHLVRRKAKVKYAHLASILLDQPVVPEFIQEQCTADSIAKVAATLTGSVAEMQRARFAEARKILAGAPGENPSAQAALFVLSRGSAADGKALAA